MGLGFRIDPMMSGKRWLSWTLDAAIVAVVVCAAWIAWPHRRWTRDHPLLNPTQVQSVRAGTLTLVDGRLLRPAGVQRLNSIDPAMYDEFLRIATAQGILVLHDQGDGTAFMQCEPRFHNWCGTSRTWEGSYFQVPLSILLVHAGYATAEPEQQGLTPHERWRLQGVQEFGVHGEPMELAEQSVAIQFSGQERQLEEYDEWLALTWKPAP